MHMAKTATVIAERLGRDGFVWQQLMWRPKVKPTKRYYLCIEGETVGPEAAHEVFEAEARTALIAYRMVAAEWRQQRPTEDEKEE